ncbi:hypothetical protein CC78DRAFT_578178 [Lojkania enalia]|uniref:Uncharacterized protein n=1 Tax=Lojkania enalia TaxID=147567 RepID=A0A9P4KEN9_9PLEO|nr:hypothetical protein CC78DRAFT_578178 [Didymosphaeria enalia]
MDSAHYYDPHYPPHTSRIGQYWDLYDEYEDHTATYTITVLCPPRPSCLSRLFALPTSPLTAFHNASSSPTSSSATTSHPASASTTDLAGYRPKILKLKAGQFFYELRCSHLRDSRTCASGRCYVMERGGEGVRWWCKEGECEGHKHMEFVKRGEDGGACFGRKGERVVCIERK